MSKSSKAKKREDQINCLKQELVDHEKKNAELDPQKIVRFDDEQLQRFLNELTQRIEWSTNRIVDETPKMPIVDTVKNQPADVFSFIMKWTISSLFFVLAIAITYSLFSIWGEFWNAGWINRIALFIVAIIGFDCAALGIEILKEKDRDYIVSLFSALVALVALIVTLVK